jgi:hypothetical protein
MEDVNAFKPMSRSPPLSATMPISAPTAPEPDDAVDSEGPELEPELVPEGESEHDPGYGGGEPGIASRNGGGPAGTRSVKRAIGCASSTAGNRQCGAWMGRAGQASCRLQGGLERLRAAQRQEVKAARLRHQTVSRRLESLQVDSATTAPVAPDFCTLNTPFCSAFKLLAVVQCAGWGWTVRRAVLQCMILCFFTIAHSIPSMPRRTLPWAMPSHWIPH